MKTDMDNTFFGWLFIRLFGFAVFLLLFWLVVSIIT